MKPQCKRPPEGWVCYLDEGHDGSCPTYAQLKPLTFEDLVAMGAQITFPRRNGGER